MSVSRFLVKSNKAEGGDEGRGALKTAAMPTTPVAKETTPCLPSQPDPAPSQPKPSATISPISSPRSPMETQPVSPPSSVTHTLPVKEEDVPMSPRAAEPRPPATERERPADDDGDGEKAGPSGLKARQFSSSPAGPPASFIPFSGGGQRLGGPGEGAAGRSPSCSSSSSALSALSAAVESPKAKKAKSSYGSNSKVSCLTET